MATVASPRREWPMDAYIAAWKTFRQLSDENAVTARHLVALPAWPKREGIIICDVGCGDGRMVEAILLECESQVKEIRLIDPDRDLLNQAQTAVSEVGLVNDIDSHIGTAEDSLGEHAVGADVILLVHVAYLMRPAMLRRTLKLLPVGTPCYVVLDEPDSIFSQLWERTAPKYFGRAQSAHILLEKIANTPDYTVTRTTIASSIRNPLELPRAELRDAVLSILCYAHVSSSKIRKHRSWIESCIQRRLDPKQRKIRCASACYEVIRRR